MKTAINFSLSIVLFLISILLFSSCSSNKLDNTEAASLISKMPNEIVKGTITMKLVESSYDKQYTLNYFYSTYGQLIDRGILTKPKFNDVQIAPNVIRFDLGADLTDSAKALVLSDDNRTYDKTYTVKCGELKFVEVVGVFQEDNSKTAEVEYKVSFISTMFANYSKMNPKYEIGQTYSKKKIAKKYDNGWRIEN